MNIYPRNIICPFCKGKKSLASKRCLKCEMKGRHGQLSRWKDKWKYYGVQK